MSGEPTKKQVIKAAKMANKEQKDKTELYEEILFWEDAIEKIREGYGKPCKEFDIDCCGCRANLVVVWIENHIDLIKYDTEYECR